MKTNRELHQKKADRSVEPKPMSKPGKQSLAWVDTAIRRELDKIGSMPNDPKKAKIGKPGSLFSVCILRIAAIAKGEAKSHYTYEQIFTQVENTCKKYPWITRRTLLTTWGRALRFANPRYRKKR